MRYLFILSFFICVNGYGQNDTTKSYMSVQYDFPFPSEFRYWIIAHSKEDSTDIFQEVFPSLGKYHLLTTDFSLYDNVIHGDFEFIESQKSIEYNRALEKRKTTFIIKAKCK